ncbi:MAG TPA: nitrile hydratase subunit beta [Gemmatimonadales bacterium]|nr:nitrile hydratase subunit beta [Gemmatimonadales bacterium]
MNGVHDMGGMHGFGPVPIEPDEPVFHAAWEGRVLALQARTRGRWYHLDEFRNAIERMPAARYLDASYYERWLTALETLLVEKGVVTREELASGHTAAPAPEPAPRPPDDRPPLHPRFRTGDRVATRNAHPPGHTRMPRYARGRHGVVRTVNGPFLLPDTNAHSRSRDWEPVYAVEFSVRELWGLEGNENVCVDLWESYLEAET